MREQKRKRLEKYKFSVNHMYKLCIVNVNVLLIHEYMNIEVTLVAIFVKLFPYPAGIQSSP